MQINHNISVQHEAAATVNGIGRITAIAAGETTITVKSGKVKESFALTVIESESKNTEAKETTISAADIEISDYQTELEVEKTMTLSASVLPADATDTKITYQSDNPQVATVKSTGEIKGIAPDIVNIILTAGTITKVVTITVTEVSTGGKITTKSIGINTILVSNGDSSNAVTVIVNSPTENTRNMPENGGELQKTFKAENTNRIINELETYIELKNKKTECPLNSIIIITIYPVK